MSNSRSNKARLDERRFPVRVRVAVPEGGFGKRFDAIMAYLDRACGRGQWAMHPGGRNAFPIDTTLFYFADAAAVAPFLEALDLKTTEIDVTLAGGSRDRLQHLHGVRSASWTHRIKVR